MNVAKVSTNGQITVPVEIRRSLKLKSGDKTDVFAKWLNKLEYWRAKQESSEDMGGFDMNEKIIVSKWDTAEFLDTQENSDAYLQVAFESGEARQITKALGNIAKARGMMDIAKKTGLTREHLYTSLSENGNPTLQTLTAIMNTLGYQLSITPIHNEQHT